MEDQRRGYMERLEAIEAGQKKQDKKLNEILMALAVLANSESKTKNEKLCDKKNVTQEEKIIDIIEISVLNETASKCANIATDGQFWKNEDDAKEEAIKNLFGL